MQIRDFKDPKSRREALEKEISTSLPHIASYTPDLEIATTKNCENMIGAAQVPMGVAGPLKWQMANGPLRQSDSEASKWQMVYLPLATTEAITEAGGAIVSTYKAGMTRGPVFYTGSIANTKKLEDFVINHQSLIINHTEKTSHHLKLKDIVIKSLTNYTFLRFSYDTGDAMGMNMVTIATQAAVEYIEKETGIPCLSVAGNFDIDKKPAWLNSIEGRGIKAWAEVVLTQKA